jgi:diguanylate cyclase (GGDEF)-like protein
VARTAPVEPVDSPPTDTARPTKAASPSQSSSDGRSSLFLKIVAAAWLLAVLLAVLDELSSVPHGAAVLAWALSMLMGVAIVTHSGQRRRLAQGAEGARADDLDPLTGLPSLGSFKQRLAEEFHRAQRYGDGFSLVLVDVNHVGEINREYGEAAGDQVLRHVVTSIDDTKRFSDIAARVGDDEFGVILQGSDEHGAKVFVERLEQRIARESATVEIDGRTISVWVGLCAGVAVCGVGESGPEQTLGKAVANLRAAKDARDSRRRLWVATG